MEVDSDIDGIENYAIKEVSLNESEGFSSSLIRQK